MLKLMRPCGLSLLILTLLSACGMPTSKPTPPSNAPTIRCEARQPEALPAKPQRPTDLFNLAAVQAYAADLDGYITVLAGIAQRNHARYTEFSRCVDAYRQQHIIH